MAQLPLEHSPGWSDPESRALAMTIAGFRGEEDIHVMLHHLLTLRSLAMKC